MNLRLVDDDPVGVSTSTRRPTRHHVEAVLAAFGVPTWTSTPSTPAPVTSCRPAWPARPTFLTHPVFNAHRSETAMLRYLRRLSDNDYALDRGMIPLGSCTMKLNATTEMEPISLAGFADLHPFAPAEDAARLRRT